MIVKESIEIVKAGGIDEEKNKSTKLSGGSWSSNLVVVARAVNDNAELLEEAMQKIDELRKEIELLKEGGID